MDTKYLGIEIGGTKLQIVLGDDKASIRERWRFDVDRKKGAIGIRQNIESSIAKILSSHTIERIGVGFGGPVNWRTGQISRSHQIEGWSEFNLGGWLAQLAKIPVRVENDANLATLGEAHHGAGRGFSPVFYVTLGSGVGGGLVLGGRIYHGQMPGEAEIGHVRLDREGTILESRCSGWAVDAKIRAQAAQIPSGLLAQLTQQSRGGEAKHLAAALEQGDPTAREILNETAGDLAFGLSHVVHLFHPEIIVIGGGLSLIGEPLRESVEQALEPLLMKVFLPGPRISLAGLGEDAVPVGALELARQPSA
jgi:glucokinase